MMQNENLLSNAQNFITPDFIRKISSEIGEPEHATEAGLRAAIPTLVAEIVSSGITQSGAEDLVDFAKNHPVDPLPPVRFTDSYLRDGEEVVHKFHEHSFSEVVSQVGASSGLSLSAVAKLLKLAAPLVFAIVGSKIRRDDLSPSALRIFLSNQAVSDESYAASVRTHVKRFRSVPVIALLILLAIVGLWWFSNLSLTSEEMEKGISTGPPHGWSP